MNGYIEDLRQLVSDQVERFISRALKNEYTVYNGLPPSGRADGTGRVGQLMNIFDPRHQSPSKDDGTSKLYIVPGNTEIEYPNNNPEFPSNLIHRLNTPFDHIDRIMLQDFSEAMGLEGDGENYFKGCFAFAPLQDTYGFSRIELSDGQGVDCSYANGVLQDSSGFFVDSFTYTPFIDHSQVGEGGDSRIGVYSDEFLNDYNTGKYDDRDVPSDSRWHQYDQNRRTISSSLYELGNLEKDIYDAKIAFRDAITYIDEEGKEKAYQTFIYTFCEHLASLFAKFSNIRMCREFYGFKPPHHEWEGILALDIWYQLLYNAVDAEYPFDDGYLNMNPMLRKKVMHDGGGDYVELDNGGKVYRNNVPTGLEWIGDETDGDYAFLWNNGMWREYDSNSKLISSRRKECVSPRGVLGKIFGIVRSGLDSTAIIGKEDGDYIWFKQKGKVYSDRDKSPWTRYVNLHFGCAYDRMSAKDYCELKNVEPVDGKFVKPSNDYGIKDDMLMCGIRALQDAFNVLKGEKAFNIFNSNSNGIEEFSPSNANGYSQSQCAVVIERVFSRIYKYLQFKSTTGETFQRHINIDNGYKYLTTDSILRSDNLKSKAYYSPSDEVPYLRYLAKLDQYRDSVILTSDEREILGKFIGILLKGECDWLKKAWNLCPLCAQIPYESRFILLETDIDRGDVDFGSGVSIDDDIDDDESEILETESPSAEEERQDGEVESSRSNGSVRSSSSSTFTVRFNYMNQSGERTFKDITVQQDEKIPAFHLNQIVEKNGRKLKFRNWRLESGNLTSHLTAASDIVFSSSYDEIDEEGEPTYQDVVDEIKGELSDAETQKPKNVFDECEFWSNHEGTGKVNSENMFYCTLTGLSPTVGGMGEIAKCPFMSMFNQDVFERNDFDVATLIEIEDVGKLISALFKINIDIAHREYFLKIDIPEKTDYWYGYVENGRYVSFEPTVELKFSNLHSANQIVNGQIVCGTNDRTDVPKIVPVNRELSDDSNSRQFNEFHYFYDYKGCLRGVRTDSDSDIMPTLYEDWKLYEVLPLHLHENTKMQSPVDANGFVRRRLSEIARGGNQIRTFTSTVKKYRPVVVPNVRDIFNNCLNNKSKYQVDLDNDYGIFGWCTIPSKTMVNMEYNEGSIVVPSSYDCRNRVGGSNFLQMDRDFSDIYKKWVQKQGVDPDQQKIGHLEENIKNTWYYLYNTRDWTYFIKPFFNIGRNNDIYSYMLDTYGVDEDDQRIDYRPTSSDHLNGVVFEPSNDGRETDSSFGDIARSCEFLAKFQHGRGSLKTLSERWTNLMSYDRLRKLTESSEDDFNSMYGSEYENLPDGFRFPVQDWVDDYNKTGSYDDGSKYRYNLGQSHSIDDFDDDSVWFYITMVEPIEELNQVVELEDIMPFVFWWDNRGEQNNGPTVDCYGLKGSAKLNYETGGYCYSGSMEREETHIDQSDQLPKPTGDVVQEQRWHTVSHTLGVDFSDKDNGNAIVTTDNSGNVLKGAFDPNCSGTDEKWKVHHSSNSFGAYQHDDPTADKYHLGYNAHGEGAFNGKKVPDQFNEVIMRSIDGRPMAWNLWNVVRHYVYIRWFRGQQNADIDKTATWQDIESRTKKIVKSIYRTFKQSRYVTRNGNDKVRSVFGDEELDDSTSNIGEKCLVHWTNSFAQIQSILERNDRKHDASLVVFTGDVNSHDNGFEQTAMSHWNQLYPGCGQMTEAAIGRCVYDKVKFDDVCNFRVTTLDGVDGYKDGMRPRKWDDVHNKWIPQDEYATSDETVYRGFKFDDMPSTFVIGDSLVYGQRLADIDITLKNVLDFDEEYPESEYHLNDTMHKWVRRIRQTVMNNQIFPIYTSMEGMEKSHHDLTVEDMKSITFQIAPQLYWKYDWSYNEFMVHRVGKLRKMSSDNELYDMLGNVWELVRDDWSENIRPVGYNPVVDAPIDNPIRKSDSGLKTIKGGAFDQLIRKTISSSRESIESGSSRSKNATQSNVGFRPSMVFSADGEIGGWSRGQPIDLFFLFDASASQDDQIGDMVESANKIIEHFAGDESNKTACNVGSALFLGHTVKLMCSQLYKERSYKMFAQLPRQRGGVNYCYDADKQEYADAMNKLYEDALAEAKRNGNSSPEDFIDKYTKDLSDDRRAYQGIDNPQTRGRMMKSMPVLRDSGQWSTGGSGSSGGTASHPYWKWEYVDMHFYTHNGVSAWVETIEDENTHETSTKLHFGTGEKQDKYHLFTADPRESAKSYYEFPFIQSKQGVLSNVYCGCEPVAHVVSNLLGSGLFYGFPWIPGIGYMFRGSDVPKLVFVYVNEYDNSIPPSSVQKSVVAVPGVDKQVVEFKHASVTAKNLFNGSTYNLLTPADPHSLQYLTQDTVISDIGDYIEKIGLGAGTGTQISASSVSSLIGNFGFGDADKWKIEATKRTMSFDNANKPNTVKSISTSFDLQNRASNDVFSWVGSWNDVKRILTGEQCNGLVSGANEFPGISYENGKMYIDSFNAMTVGFYELHNTVSRMSNPVNAYFMVSDADAPTKLATLTGNIGGIDNPDLFLMSRDYLYFEKMGGKNVPGAVGTNPLPSRSNITYDDLVYANLAWIKNTFANTNPTVDNDDVDGLDTIFGLENPYTKNTIVLGLRNGGNHFFFEETAKYVDSGINRITANFIIGLPLDGSTSDLNESKFKKKLENHTWEWMQSRVWTVENWINNKNGCRMKLTKDNANLYYVSFKRQFSGVSDLRDSWGDISSIAINKLKPLTITKFVSSESVRSDNHTYYSPTFGDYYNDKAFSNKMVYEDAITVSYRDANNNVTGTLKIIGLTSIAFGILGSNAFAPLNKCYFNRGSNGARWKELINAIRGDGPIDPADSYPEMWKKALKKYADKNFPYNYNSYLNQFSQMWIDNYAKVKQLYGCIKDSAPILMAYRYYKQMFSNMVNNCGESGKDVTDYEDDENVTIFKPLPIMEFSNMDRVFSTSFKNGQFNVSSFSYSHCVVDLNPQHSEEYEDGKFPMRFTSIYNVNTDEYKTSKLVLQRIDSISGERVSQFEMGSHETDYEKIEDPSKLKYRDAESIVSKAKDDYVNVKLTNGGSYQRNGDFYGILDGHGKKKYRKNRHFFIDPFELTISQWCYANGFHKGDESDGENARSNLSGSERGIGSVNFSQMEESYWKYVMTWEPDEWRTIRTNGVEMPDGTTQVLVSTDDKMAIKELVEIKAYNPLKDTRPFYYATYDIVRGNNGLYQMIPPQTSPTNYVFDRSKGDEYQLNENIGTVSFMDILNSNVVFKTKEKTYVRDSVDGGEAVTLGDEGWYSGKHGGMDFDLPTEAQWEHCCRNGDSSAFPVNHILGKNFEENDESLDLIAWYKYKVIGSLPEPERFCAWRVQKFLFGISKDKEQINNVYETTF